MIVYLYHSCQIVMLHTRKKKLLLFLLLSLLKNNNSHSKKSVVLALSGLITSVVKIYLILQGKKISYA